MEIKLSDYLNDILDAHAKAYKHNEFRNRELDRAKKWHPDPEAYVTMHYGEAKILPHIPTMEELEATFKGKFQTISIIAKIGHEGKKVHRVSIEALDTPEGWIIYRASSFCGSQKWSPTYGRSPIFPFNSDDLDKVNCDKCLGIRVKGGKDQIKTQYKCRSCGHEDSLTRFIDRSKPWAIRHYHCPQCGSTGIPERQSRKGGEIR